MASHECGEVNNNLDLYASGSETERNDKFWNSSVSSMKFTLRGNGFLRCARQGEDQITV